MAIATATNIGAWAGTPIHRSWPRKRNDAGKLVKVSTPCVIASARPRKSENVPNVTIKGGSRSRVMSSAFNPPPIAPNFSEQHRTQPKQRTDGQIDSAGENDRRHRQRQQADLDRVPDDIEAVI